MHENLEKVFHPSISIIVPAYNSERTISKILKSLFTSAAQYPGSCEIIVVDDGSSDYTYEIAWATINRCKRTWPNVHGKVVRHTAKLGIKEAAKTGGKKASGTLIAVVDAQIDWKTHMLREFMCMTEKKGLSPIDLHSLV